MFKKGLSALFLIGAILIILILQLSPHYFAFFSTPKGFVFGGHAAWFDPWDINVYISAIRWAQEHGFSFANAYTTLPHKPVILWPFYTVVGMLFPNINSLILYHSGLLSLSVIICFCIWYLAKLFLRTNTKAVVALILTALGGGLGWLSPIVLVPDITITPFTFTSTFQRPHELFSVIVYLFSLYMFYFGVTKIKPSLVLFSSFLLIFLTILYPYYLLSYYVICGVYVLLLVIRSKRFIRYPILFFFFAVAATLPFGLLYSAHLILSSGFESVLLPSLGTPNIILVALGYGMFMPVILFQLFRVKKDSSLLFLNVWFFASIMLAYLPIGFARYYLRALFFPATLICLITLPAIAQWLRIRLGVLLFLLLFFAPITTVVITYERFQAIRNVSEWVYITSEAKEAFDFLNTHTALDSGVLATYPLSNYIPAATHNTVYIGHWFQTPNAAEKIKNLRKFYRGEFSEEKAKLFLKTSNISYVLLDRNNALYYNFLKKVFENRAISIYNY